MQTDRQADGKMDLTIMLNAFFICKHAKTLKKVIII